MEVLDRYLAETGTAEPALTSASSTTLGTASTPTNKPKPSASKTTAPLKSPEPDAVSKAGPKTPNTTGSAGGAPQGGQSRGGSGGARGEGAGAEGTVPVGVSASAPDAAVKLEPGLSSQQGDAGGAMEGVKAAPGGDLGSGTGATASTGTGTGMSAGARGAAGSAATGSGTPTVPQGLPLSELGPRERCLAVLGQLASSDRLRAFCFLWGTGPAFDDDRLAPHPLGTSLAHPRMGGPGVPSMHHGAAVSAGSLSMGGIGGAAAGSASPERVKLGSGGVGYGDGRKGLGEEGGQPGVYQGLGGGQREGGLSGSGSGGGSVKKGEKEKKGKGGSGAAKGWDPRPAVARPLDFRVVWLRTQSGLYDRNLEMFISDVKQVCFLLLGKGLLPTP